MSVAPTARSRRAATQRAGMATLEFAMALPVLLVLMVGITWLGFSVIAQTEVLVEARNKAWQKRFDDKAKNPLVFPGVNPLYSATADFVTEKATKRVDVSPIFNAMPAPEASCTVLAGAWDYRAMDMNSPPNFTLSLRAVANAATKDVQTQLGNLKNLAQRLDQVGASAIAEALTQGNQANSQANASQSAGNSGDSEAKEQKRKEKEDIQRQQQDLGGSIPPYPLGNNQVVPTSGGQLDQTNDEIIRLQYDLDAKRRAPPLKDEEQEKKRQAELDQMERRIRLLQDKKQRIEAEIRDNDEELKGFD